MKRWLQYLWNSIFEQLTAGWAHLKTRTKSAKNIKPPWNVLFCSPPTPPHPPPPWISPWAPRGHGDQNSPFLDLFFTQINPGTLLISLIKWVCNLGNRNCNFMIAAFLQSSRFLNGRRREEENRAPVWTLEAGRQSLCPGTSLALQPGWFVISSCQILIFFVVYKFWEFGSVNCSKGDTFQLSVVHVLYFMIFKFPSFTFSCH